MQFSRSAEPASGPPIPQSQTVRDEDIIDLGALLSTLWRGKFWIALMTFIAILIGGYYAYVVAVPKYRATAVVILETDQQQLLDLQGVESGLSGDASEVNSEVAVLRGRSLMGKVVDRLDLVNDPEFNGDLRDLSTIDALREGANNLLGLTASEVILPEDEKIKRTRDAVVSNLLEATTVRNAPLSLVFQVTVETDDARKSALIADTIVELYILNQIEVKFEATETATLWLSERVAELQANLQDAEAEVSNFSATTELVSIEGLQALERQIKELRDRIGLAETSRGALQNQITALEEAETRGDQVDLATDTQLTRLLPRAVEDSDFEQTFDARLDLVVARLRADLMRADQ